MIFEQIIQNHASIHQRPTEKQNILAAPLVLPV